MSFKEVQLVIEGYDQKMRERAELLRTHAFLSNPYIKPGVSITKFWPLRWDDYKPPKVSTPEEFKRRISEAEKRVPNLKRGDIIGRK